MPSKLLHSFVPQLLPKRSGQNMDTMVMSCISICITSSRGTSCRRKDLLKIEESVGLDELVVLHHVHNCWLSLLTFFTMYSCHEKFLHPGSCCWKNCQRNDKSIVNNDNYLAIKNALDSREVDG